MKHDEGTVPLHEPMAELERQLIAAFVAGAGYSLDTLLARNDEEARRLLAEASSYTSARLSEIEARSQYIHTLHGQS